MVSIIIPVYNAEKYLPACIESIIAQTFTDWELILVDDGSADGSGRICDEFSQRDKRIVVVHKTNGGPSTARNLGIKKAKGDFVTFIDADDIIKPSFLANFSYDPTLDFEIQGFNLHYMGNPDDDRDVMPKETRVAHISDIYAESELNRLSRGPVCKLFKRRILTGNNVEYPLGINFAEDAIFVKRYLTFSNGQARAIAAADYIYNHFEASGSLTQKRHSGQMMYDVVQMDVELFKELERNWGGLPDKLKVEFMHLRSLEFYNSVCLFLTEDSQTFQSCQNFIFKAKDELFEIVGKMQNLPPTYRIIKTILELPSWLSVVILKVMFAIRRPVA